MEPNNANQSEAKNTKILNKLGTIAFGLIVLGSFLPAVTIPGWEDAIPTTGVDAYGFFVVFLMFVGAAGSALGLPKLIVKGIAGFSLAYLYYHLFGAISDMNDIASMFGGRHSGELAQVAQVALQIIDIGIYVLLAGFVLLNLFMFKSYVIHPRFDALDTLLKHYTSQVTEKVATKSAEIKKAADEKSAQIKKAAEEKSAQIKEAAKEKATQTKK
ncbi:hypothetical protein [Marinomonas flavescens]|uniref:hypothetical protein n=1 Tax=Marinomonas flavescens TaxID=2529379 RepID=UPI0010563CA1|nr:hypothetical protein [Marinomonas flavescens]